MMGKSNERLIESYCLKGVCQVLEKIEWNIKCLLICLGCVEGQRSHLFMDNFKAELEILMDCLVNWQGLWNHWCRPAFLFSNLGSSALRFGVWPRRQEHHPEIRGVASASGALTVNIWWLHLLQLAWELRTVAPGFLRQDTSFLKFYQVDGGLRP